MQVLTFFTITNTLLAFVNTYGIYHYYRTGSKMDALFYGAYTVVNILIILSLHTGWVHD